MIKTRIDWIVPETARGTTIRTSAGVNVSIPKNAHYADVNTHAIAHEITFYDSGENPVGFIYMGKAIETTRLRRDLGKVLVETHQN